MFTSSALQAGMDLKTLGISETFDINVCLVMYVEPSIKRQFYSQFLAETLLSRFLTLLYCHTKLLQKKVVKLS